MGGAHAERPRRRRRARLRPRDRRIGVPRIRAHRADGPPRTVRLERRSGRGTPAEPREPDGGQSRPAAAHPRGRCAGHPEDLGNEARRGGAGPRRAGGGRRVGHERPRTRHHEPDPPDQRRRPRSREQAPAQPDRNLRAEGARDAPLPRPGSRPPFLLPRPHRCAPAARPDAARRGRAESPALRGGAAHDAPEHRRRRRRHRRPGTGDAHESARGAADGLDGDGGPRTRRRGDLSRRQRAHPAARREPDHAGPARGPRQRTRRPHRAHRARRRRGSRRRQRRADPGRGGNAPGSRARFPGHRSGAACGARSESPRVDRLLFRGRDRRRGARREDHRLECRGRAALRLCGLGSDGAVRRPPRGTGLRGSHGPAAHSRAPRGARPTVRHGPHAQGRPSSGGVRFDLPDLRRGGRGHRRVQDRSGHHGAEGRGGGVALERGTLPAPLGLRVFSRLGLRRQGKRQRT